MVPTTMFDVVDIDDPLLDDECEIILKRITVLSFACTKLKTFCSLAAALIEAPLRHGEKTAAAKIRFVVVSSFICAHVT
jgi:hypothetical protein